MTPRIVLVGFMGAGKSTVGPLLAAKLGWDFVDMDHRVEERLGMSVADAFERLGEPAFRQEEEAVARELLERTQTVVAAGGGAFTQEPTRQLLQQQALALWLRVPLEVAEARIGAGHGRPLAANRARIRGLFALREPSYAGADRIVEVGDGSPDAVAQRVFEVVLACRSARTGEGDTGCGT